MNRRPKRVCPVTRLTRWDEKAGLQRDAISSRRMDAYGAILLATAHDFIELYLSPEEKKKAFGFDT
jgi:hypothetical protein